MIYEFLQRVTFTEKLIRCYRGDKIMWKSKELNESIHGVVIGERTLTNGLMVNNEDEGSYYKKVSHFKCSLIVFNQYENPIYVPFEAIKEL